MKMAALEVVVLALAWVLVYREGAKYPRRNRAMKEISITCTTMFCYM